MVDFDTTARQLLDAMGPPEMANLTPVLGKFGSLNVVVGSDRVLMRRPPGVRGRVGRKHERDVVGADPGRLSDRARFATALRRLSIL